MSAQKPSAARFRYENNFGAVWVHSGPLCAAPSLEVQQCMKIQTVYIYICLGTLREFVREVAREVAQCAGAERRSRHTIVTALNTPLVLVLHLCWIRRFGRMGVLWSSIFVILSRAERCSLVTSTDLYRKCARVRHQVDTLFT